MVSKNKYDWFVSIHFKNSISYFVLAFKFYFYFCRIYVGLSPLSLFFPVTLSLLVCINS
ncbi:hypothetical protein ACE6H2_023238 [Prunus campanulata]